MIRRFASVILFLMVFISPTLADSELWSTNALQLPFYRVKFNVIPELRFRNNMSEWYYLRTYIGPSMTLNKQFDLAAYIAPSWNKNGGSWTTSNLLYLDLIYKNSALSNRARLEQNLSSGVLIYRNSLQLKIDNWTLADEPFYNFFKGFIDENRASFGYSFGIFSVGYLLRSQKATAGSDWVQTNVANLGLKVNF